MIWDAFDILPCSIEQKQNTWNDTGHQEDIMAECLLEFTNAELPFSGTEVLDAGKKMADAAP